MGSATRYVRVCMMSKCSEVLVSSHWQPAIHISPDVRIRTGTYDIDTRTAETADLEPFSPNGAIVDRHVQLE